MERQERARQVMAAIDDIHRSVSINGKESETTEYLVNYLTANVDDIVDDMQELEEEEEEWTEL